VRTILHRILHGLAARYRDTNRPLRYHQPIPQLAMDSKIFREVKKKKQTKDTVVRFRCNRQEKQRWVERAKRAGITLSELITKQLNKF